MSLFESHGGSPTRSKDILGFEVRSYDEALERIVRARKTTISNRVCPRHKSQMRTNQEKVTN